MPTQGGFSENSLYEFHGHDEDVLLLAACQVRIWLPHADEASATVYTEVSHIEIHNSYKEPVSTATVVLPRGSVIKFVQREREITTGNGTTMNGENSYLQGGNRDVIVDGTTKEKDGTPIYNAEPTRADFGLVKTSDLKIVGENDLAVGNNISITCGYVETEEDLETVRNGGYATGMQKLFTGIIIGCSTSSPFKLECESRMSILKKVANKKQIVKNNLSIKQLFGSGDGCYDLLAGSGLRVSDRSLNSGIMVGTIDFMANSTIMEIFRRLAERGIMSWLNDDGDIEFGVNLYMNGIEETDPKSIAYQNGGNGIQLIQFDWHVAQDNLSVTRVEKDYIAIRAKAQVDEHRIISVLARKGTNDGSWIFQNERNVEFKKYKKKKGGTTVYGKTRGKDSSLDGYTVIRFTSNTAKNMDELKKEALAYWGKVNPNAMEGTVSVFGNVDVKTPSVVGLVDPRNPEKEGYYLVESVSIEFSVDTGYRRHIKFSHKLKGLSDGTVYIPNNVISV